VDQPHPFQPKFEHAFSIAITLRPAIYMSPSASGQTRAAVYLEEGTVSGRINGRVMPGSGGDWALIRGDDVLDFDARYLLELDDGTVIYMQNRGYRWGSEAAMQAMREQKIVDPSEYYMRVTPRFEGPAGPHEWLYRHVFVGVAEKIPSANCIHYFTVL
jgi:hypothetical protein